MLTWLPDDVLLEISKHFTVRACAQTLVLVCRKLSKSCSDAAILSHVFARDLVAFGMNSPGAFDVRMTVSRDFGVPARLLHETLAMLGEGFNANDIVNCRTWNCCLPEDADADITTWNKTVAFSERMRFDLTAMFWPIATRELRLFSRRKRQRTVDEFVTSVMHCGSSYFVTSVDTLSFADQSLSLLLDGFTCGSFVDVEPWTPLWHKNVLVMYRGVHLTVFYNALKEFPDLFNASATRDAILRQYKLLFTDTFDKWIIGNPHLQLQVEHDEYQQSSQCLKDFTLLRPLRDPYLQKFTLRKWEGQTTALNDAPNRFYNVWNLAEGISSILEKAEPEQRHAILATHIRKLPPRVELSLPRPAPSRPQIKTNHTPPQKPTTLSFLSLCDLAHLTLVTRESQKWTSDPIVDRMVTEAHAFGDSRRTRRFVLRAENADIGNCLAKAIPCAKIRRRVAARLSFPAFGDSAFVGNRKWLLTTQHDRLNAMTIWTPCARWDMTSLLMQTAEETLFTHWRHEQTQGRKRQIVTNFVNTILQSPCSNESFAFGPWAAKRWSSKVGANFVFQATSLLSRFIRSQVGVKLLDVHFAGETRSTAKVFSLALDVVRVQNSLSAIRERLPLVRNQQTQEAFRSWLDFLKASYTPHLMTDRVPEEMAANQADALNAFFAFDGVASDDELNADFNLVFALPFDLPTVQDCQMFWRIWRWDIAHP